MGMRSIPPNLQMSSGIKTASTGTYSPRDPDAGVDERIFQGSFKGMGRGLWGGLFLGFVIGASIGAVAAFAPLLVGGTITLNLLGTCALGFGVLGMSKGFATGIQVGSVAGGVASGTKEVLKEVHESEARITSLITQAMPQLKNANATPASKAKESASQLKTPQEKKSTFSKYFNVKVMLAMAAIGALGGLAFGLAAAGGPVALAAANLLGISSNLTFGLMVVSALWASTFGINIPVIINKVSDKFGEILSGKVFEKKIEKSISPAIASETGQSASTVAIIPRQLEKEITTHRDMIGNQRQISAIATGQGI